MLIGRKQEQQGLRRLYASDEAELVVVYGRRRVGKTYLVNHVFDDDEFVFGALKNGASGYLLKGSSLQELSSAIRTVYSGGAMINPNVASKVIQQFSSMAKNIVNPGITETDTSELTKSEWEIIQAVARGLSNKEIAETLWLSQGTVRNSISSILNKLHLRDRTQLAIWAVQSGVVNKDIFGS